MSPSIYLLNHATKDIGRGGYPQNQKMSEGYDYEASNSIHKLRPSHFADFVPNFDSIKIMDGSKLTDLISSAPVPWCVLIVSKKLLDVLTGSRLPPYKVYPAPLIYRGQPISGYYAIHIITPENYLGDIDFKNSKIWITELISHEKIELLQLSSAEELLKESERISKMRHHPKQPTLNLWAEDLKLKKEFYNLVDLFSIPYITYPVSFYVTESLKLKIEQEGCTGVSFRCVSEEKDSLQDYFGNKVLTFFP